LAAPAVFAESPGELVERYIDAYNAHDVNGMLELASPDIRWLRIDGETVHVEADGAEDLGDALRDYFDSVPSSRSRIDWIRTAGDRVSLRECARWRSDEQWREQCALSVYEIVDGRVATVWYFPAERASTP
jgi:hypothetical protein